jgi:hypothetical protein
MKTNRIIACIALVLTAAPAYSQDTESVDDILKKMVDAMSGLKSWTADIEMNMNLMSMEMSTTGQMKQAGKRSAMEMTMKMQMPGLEGLGELADEMDKMMGGIKMKTVMDEDGIQWTEMNMMGQLQVMKMDMNKMMEASSEMAGLSGIMGGGNPFELMGDPVKMLEMYKALMDFEFVGKDVLDGIEVYVLKGSMKIGIEESNPAMEALSALAPGMDSITSDITMKVGIEDGFVRETTMGEMDGKPIMVMRMKNVKLDVEIDESTFRYEPPAGVTVMDMTEMMTENFEELLEDEEDEEVEQP